VDGNIGSGQQVDQAPPSRFAIATDASRLCVGVCSLEDFSSFLCIFSLAQMSGCDE
jgi:hypothetical protein